MTSSHLIDTEQLLADQLAQASPDLLRGLLSTFIAALMGAEAAAAIPTAESSALETTTGTAIRAAISSSAEIPPSGATFSTAISAA